MEDKRKKFYKILITGLFVLFSIAYTFKFFVMLSVLEQIIGRIISNFYIANLLPGLILMSIYGIVCLSYLSLSRKLL